MKTVQDVKTAVEKHGITRWKLRQCSLCNYPLSYVFAEDRVGFDRGCHCTGQRDNIEECGYERVADAFNIQSSPEIYDRMWSEFIASGTRA